MNKRKFLKASALAATASALPQLHKPLFAQNLSGPPYEIVMGGYGPSTTGFSAALREVGSHLENVFGDEVDVRYVYNIMDLGYQGSDILWLVENGLLTLGYQSSSYMNNLVQELMIADITFLFNTGEDARNAMDGDLGSMLATAIENNMNYRILGYFENGFRHISNRLRPIHSLEDLADLHIRVLPSQILYDTFVQLGANPEIMDLSDALRRIPAGLIDAQENPLANTVTMEYTIIINFIPSPIMPIYQDQFFSINKPLIVGLLSFKRKCRMLLQMLLPTSETYTMRKSLMLLESLRRRVVRLLRLQAMK
jgi:TRAP-type C4-dicarboxylate transport system substrate-binding protein